VEAEASFWTARRRAAVAAAATCQIPTAGTASANLFPNTVCDQPCRFPITYSRRFARVTATFMIFGLLPAQLLAPGVLPPRTRLPIRTPCPETCEQCLRGLLAIRYGLLINLFRPFVYKRFPRCLELGDHIPIRSLPYFKARRLLSTLLIPVTSPPAP
jgi:hypothetical protein